MKRLFYPFILLGILFLGCFQEVSASHVMGADIVVTHVTGLEYQVTVSLYRDCSGLLPGPGIDVTIASSCGSTNLEANLVGTPTDITPLCPFELPNSTCQPGSQSQPGMEHWLYQDNIILPAACDDWTFSVRECNRNFSISTLINPSSECVYAYVNLDNVNAPTNSSPYFTQKPLAFICANNPYVYNHGAVDPDGDSLVYSLVDALDDAGTSVLYIPGYSGTNPMTTSPTVTIDPVNGNIFINPIATEIAVLVVKIEEYRNGVLIGSTNRDIQVTVENCANASPIVFPITNLTGGSLLGPTTIEICPDSTLTFSIPGSDPLDGLGDSLFVTWNNAIAGALFTPDANIDTVTGTFSWTPTAADVGFNSFTVTLSDNGCPIISSQILAFDIFVFDGTWAGPDKSYCTAGSPVGIVPVGGTNFTWNVISGDAGSVNCNGPACDSVQLNPNVTTEYEVVSNFSCGNIDTVVVNVIPNFVMNTTPDTAICIGSSFRLQSLPTPAGSYGDYSWLWSPSPTLDDDTLLNPVAAPSDTTTYEVEITSAAGCTLRDTVTLAVANVALGSSPVTDPSQSCAGDPVLLDAQVSVGGCNGYTGDTISLAPVPLVAPLTGPTGDEQTTGILQIGFDFEFYCQKFSQFFISSNGWIMFTSQGPDGSPSPIPLPGDSDHLIALAWDDLNPASGGAIRYETQGVAPNRRLVVEYDSVPHFLCATCFVDGQIILYEGTNVIEIHSVDIDENSIIVGNITQGIENVDGTDGLAVPGRNFASWTSTGDAYRFSPLNSITYTHSWEYPLGTVLSSTDSAIVTPSVNTVYYSRTEAGSGACVIIDSVEVQTASLDAGPDDCIAPGDTSTLNGIYSGPPPPTDCNIYTVDSIPFDTADISAIAIPLFPLAVNAELTNFEPIGFPFEFFCTSKDSFQLSENGWLSFTFGLDDDRSNDMIPSTNGRGDMIAFVHDDLDPNLSGANPRIEYATIGTAPNRQLIVNFFNVNHAGRPDSTVSVQVKLFETTNRIEMHVVKIEHDGGFYTMGIEDTTETRGFSVPGRNFANVHASNEAWRFTPLLGILEYSWSPSDSLSDTTIANPDIFPAGPMNYVLTVNNGVCTLTDTIFVNTPPGCIPLPIESLELEGKEMGDVGQLRWTTGTEENTSYFILERSHEGQYFSELYREDAAGFSEEPSTYHFQDIQPHHGLNYYRVTGVDHDGATVQSNTVVLDFTTTGNGLLGVYPNPSTGRVHFDLLFSDLGSSRITIQDLSGRVLTTQTRTWEVEGIHTQTLELGGLAQGIYLYQILIKGEVFIGKLQIIK